MRYDGGKGGSGVYQKIINLMPKHDVYIEPFIGGGNIFERKRPARSSIVMDADAIVCDHWKTLALPGCTVIHGDALIFLHTYPFTGNELVYCDPPYILSTRRGGKIYRHEMTDDEHKLLASILSTIPAKVILSGYRHAIYDDGALSTWNSIDFTAQTRRGPATETLWFNFEPPSELHDFQYLGQNFRDRERIKRKKKRWHARLLKMDASERLAILELLNEIGDAAA